MSGRGPNHPRHTTLAVSYWESAKDAYRDALVDGVIDGEEDAEISAILEDGYQVAMEADEGVRISVALLRGGRNSVNARRYGFDPADVDLACA